MYGLIGAFVEAWGEFRVHRARVLLSLVGVGVAVCALTGVVGVGQVAQQAQIEQLERGSGRPATLMLAPPFDPVTGEQAGAEELATAFEQIVERYSIDYAGSVLYTSLQAQFPDGVSPLDAVVVEPDYGVMHRMQLARGEWFSERDTDRLAPAVIVSDFLWQRLGSPDLASHPTMTLLGRQPTTAVIVGVTPPESWDSSRAYLLTDAYAELAPELPEWMGQMIPQYELWVPAELADVLTERIRADLSASFGEGWQAQVQRNDYLAWSDGDPLAPLRLVLLAIAGLILLLGALGLVNIALVTVRQRIREIGIRRAFGATAGRVFLAVMLESVVATVVAGLVGVIGAILLVQNDWIRGNIAPGLTDVPPFPAEAALIGLLSATAVGALAGLLPALVAVRVKVIDAIRY